MDWTRRIDGYCERVGPEFWSEPVNAITNGAFIIAGVYALIVAIRANRTDAPVLWLTFLVLAIGTGSFLFHTYATVWAVMADTGPIALFILSYLIISFWAYFHVGWGKSVLIGLGAMVLMGLVSGALRPLIGAYVNNSQSYFPAMMALFIIGGILIARGHRAGKWLVAAGGVFVASLTFRSIDEMLCAGFPLGTHFAWHILNGVVLGTLVIALIRHGRDARAVARARATG
jgi:hypothetical protein